jgi:putative ABC transport system substrate-binding protein
MVALIATLMSFPIAGRAQPQPRRARIGYLWVGIPGSEGQRLQGVRQGLAEVGLVEGQGLQLELRYADGHPERLRGLADELVRLKVDIIVAVGTVATHAARAASSTIPIISASSDPVGEGFARSLARPGGNITGMTIAAGDRLVEKWLQLLKELTPAIKQVALVRSESTGGMNEIAVAAGRRLGVEVMPRLLTDAGMLDPMLAQLEKTAPGGLIVSSGALLSSMGAQLVAFAARLRIPAIYGHRDYVVAGGLMSYATSNYELWRRVGVYADKILKGAKPGDLPIEQPTRFELVINMRTARALGLRIPQALLLRADEVIE